MGIRKFKADYLFTGTDVFSLDKVLITDDYGVIKDLYDVKDAGDNVEIHKGILCPGFINTHCHTELSHMKGKIPPGTGLIEFLTRVIRERNFQEADVTSAMEAAVSEMYDSGIVAVGDICNTTDSLQVKKDDKISWFNFIEVLGFNPQDAPARIEYSTRVVNDFNNNIPSTVPDHVSFYHSSLSPHAPYSVSEDLFKLINEATAAEIVTIHNQESNAENELYVHKSGRLFDLYKNLNISADPFQPTGKTSLQSYLPWLTQAGKIILVHNVATTAEDISFIKFNCLSNIHFCICINANRYIQSQNPPIELLRKENCNIVLGTDSYASNHQLNILEEIKTIHKEFPGITLPETLQWATINGAKALGMDTLLGSFDVGKQPGIVIINNITNQQLSADSISKRLL